MKLIYSAEVSESGKLIIHNKIQFLKDIEGFSGKQINISIERKKKKSNQQMRAYRGYILPMVHAGLKDLGWQVSLEWVHLHLREKFLQSEVVNEQTGEVMSYIKSTTELDTFDFNSYIADIQQYGAEDINIVIPDPDEQTTLNFER